MENSPQPIPDIRQLASEAFHAKRINLESARAIFELLEGLEENVEHISHIVARYMDDFHQRQGEAMGEDARAFDSFQQMQ